MSPSVVCRCGSVLVAIWACGLGAASAGAAEAATPAAIAPEDAAFFNDRVLPILRSRCFECHSHDHEINGGLALDVKSGWQEGGQSGPAVIPGKPEESLLIAAVRRTKPDYEMPPDGPIADDEVATLVEWVARGGPDPRKATAGDAWEKVYAERLKWWSLQPLARPDPPGVVAIERLAPSRRARSRMPRIPKCPSRVSLAARSKPIPSSATSTRGQPSRSPNVTRTTDAEAWRTALATASPTIRRRG